PPFLRWVFRDPTDGRTASVGMECFPASNARAWDRHKRAGRLLVPTESIGSFVIQAEQVYWYHCQLCGREEPLCPPQRIERRFEPVSQTEDGEVVWRYTLKKHDNQAFLDITRHGYVADSANIGFGPWEGEL
ncbi:MAG TPA: hypothetical protein VKU00_33915, partial [Chthonomonadaceae bacterium]|nr:hypothetical protein [Chthonomonadaceae bacterium]